MAAGGAHALVFEVDVGRCVEHFLQPPGADQRARAVQAISLADRLGDLDLALGAHFLADEGHGEEWRQIARADGLSRSRMKDRLGRHREVGDDVVPALRDALLVEDELGPLGWIAIDAHVALTHRCSSSQGSWPLSGRLRPRNPHCVRHGLE